MLLSCVFLGAFANPFVLAPIASAIGLACGLALFGILSVMGACCLALVAWRKGRTEAHDALRYAESQTSETAP
jgi:hypothetical protein